ncbi:exodeoxyribonuclease VII large subunit [Neosynechococcus sphagnicola]|uniref:exodeoxyribonuclease VII large subunit n=1 Tax=Neosynechococcus sphagnicola TaxID=1501145 RepID=UPI0023BAD55F|nr:exodeoxyribonuclease VII large subunit [Neosynechococcus sphagnicola]
MQAALAQQFQNSHDRLQRLRDRLWLLKLDHRMHQEIQAIAWVRQRLLQVTRQHFQQANQHCKLLGQTLATLDPQAVLRRGYAIVRQRNGTITRSATTLTVGQPLHIQLNQGQVEVQITEILQSD